MWLFGFILILFVVQGFRSITNEYSPPMITPTKTIPLEYCNPFTLKNDIPIISHLKKIEQPYLFGEIPYKYYLVVEWEEGSEIYTMESIFCKIDKCNMYLVLDTVQPYELFLEIDNDLKITMRLPEQTIVSNALKACLEINTQVILRSFN